MQPLPTSPMRITSLQISRHRNFESDLPRGTMLMQESSQDNHTKLEEDDEEADWICHLGFFMFVFDMGLERVYPPDSGFLLFFQTVLDLLVLRSSFDCHLHSYTRHTPLYGCL